MGLFKKILKQDIDIKSVCNQIKIHMDINSKLQLIHVMFGLSKADNNIHKNELSTISNIARLIGLNEKDFNSIKAMFIENTESAYKILGLDSKSNNSEIKLAYRKMAAKFHPDKVAHLGEEFTKVAEEKFKAVNNAYQQLKKDRNIS